jgi:ArsR family transcriptional regulator
MREVGKIGLQVVNRPPAISLLTHQLRLMYYAPMLTEIFFDTERAVRLFRALSDEKRLRILMLLRDGERCVCDLTEALDAGQSLLSFHLKALKEAGLVTDRREGRWSYYTLETGALEEAEALLAALRPDEHASGRGSSCCS